MTRRRAPCKIDAPRYVRETWNEPFLEHRMLFCMSVCRQLALEDLASMHGRRGLILLVHGLIQARASNLLGGDWLPCAEEVARMLDALARKTKDNLADDDSGESVDSNHEATVLETLFAINPDATDAVTVILSRRSGELKRMEVDEKKSRGVKTEQAVEEIEPKAKRPKRSHPSSSAKILSPVSAKSTSPSSSKTAARSPATQKPPPALLRGSSSVSKKRVG